MLAMHMDYRVMNPARGFACINELDFGVPLKPAMSAIFRSKCTPTTYRQLVLEAHRFGGTEAKEVGIVDVTGGLEEVIQFVQERKLTEKGKTGIYGLMKREMYRETVEGYLTAEGYEREEERERRIVKEEEERKEKGKSIREVKEGLSKL